MECEYEYKKKLQVARKRKGKMKSEEKLQIGGVTAGVSRRVGGER